MEISLVVPVYNSADVLDQSIKKINLELKGLSKNYEIIIAEDGSSDGSDIIASKLSKKFSRIKYIHSSKKKGKGKAIKDAFKLARGNILAFMDVDLSTNLSSFPKLIEAIENGADVAIGSRLLKESKVERKLTREILSRSYVFLIKLLFRTKIKDFQCGFKAFKRKTLPVLLAAKNNEFFWDTEALILAERKGLKIVEIPVKWKEAEKTKINLIKSPLKMFYSLLKLRVNLVS
jgi:hypothetical protein